MRFILPYQLLLALPLGALPAWAASSVPDPPSPESIKLKTLPLPPTLPNDSAPGTCTEKINSRGTGCIRKGAEGFAGGGFLPDGKHVLIEVTYVGGAADSLYNGPELLAVKTDGGKFPNGDPWKCLTCGVEKVDEVLDYGQAFSDGKRALAGINLLDCGKHDLVSPECNQKTLKIYHMYWQTSTNASAPGGALREVRLHPDDVHLGFNSFTTGATLGQFAYIGRLKFNPAPSFGSPRVPRYDVVQVTRLFDPKEKTRVEAVGKKLIINSDVRSIGELRGFSGDGKEAVYVGTPIESSNIDAFAVDLSSGKTRRITNHPEYVDPIASSPDSNWWVIEDTRGTDRQMWLSGMRDIPPLTDLVTTSITSSTRNNGARRFFLPYLLDRWGDRGDYYGQRLNDQGSGKQGSGDFNDPMWNAMADPRWSPNGVQIVWWETQAVSPACGGINPLPCYPSKEPGGREYRAVVATLSSRKPYNPIKVKPISDSVPWGVVYVPDSPSPSRPKPPPGTYTLDGKSTGFADVKLLDNPKTGSINAVQVAYHEFSDDGETYLNGTESVSLEFVSQTTNRLDWWSDLEQTIADQINTKKTGPKGFQVTIDVLTNIFNANGTLTTKVDGVSYYQPDNGT